MKPRWLLPTGLCIIVFSAARSSAIQYGPVTCTLTEVARSAPAAEFSHITSLAVDSKHRLYVGDRLLRSVTVLDQHARILRRIGRGGSGPGEFRFIWSVQTLPGDSLAVYDIDLGRLTVFAPASDEVAYTRSLASVRGARTPNRVALLPRDRQIVAQYFHTFTTRDDPQGDYAWEQVVRVLNWDGSLLRDSVLVVPAPQQLVARQGGYVTIASFPFGWPALLRVSQTGHIYYAKGDSLKVSVFDLKGELERVLRSDYRPPPVTRLDIARALDELSDRLHTVLREAAPERWPALRQLLVDNEERVWLGLQTPYSSPGIWQVYTASGDQVCTFRLPRAVELRLVTDERAYGVVLDELHVPTVVIYEVSLSADSARL